MTSPRKAAIHLGPNYVSKSETYKNTKCEEMNSLFNITLKLVVEHSEEILNVKCLEYSSPSYARSALAKDQAVKWAKAAVCVHLDSFLCVGQVKHIQGATARWKGPVEDLKKSSSYQVAVGIDGEAIEFEWHNFPGFSSLSVLEEIRRELAGKKSSPKSSRTESSSCQCARTLLGQKERMMKIVVQMPEKSGITRGPRSEEKWYGDFRAQNGERDS